MLGFTITYLIPWITSYMLLLNSRQIPTKEKLGSRKFAEFWTISTLFAFYRYCASYLTRFLPKTFLNWVVKVVCTRLSTCFKTLDSGIRHLIIAAVTLIFMVPTRVSVNVPSLVLQLAHSYSLDAEIRPYM